MIYTVLQVVVYIVRHFSYMLFIVLSAIRNYIVKERLSEGWNHL